jgi:hypothetical protein
MSNVFALTLPEFHDTWAWVVTVTNGIAGVWALGAHRVEALRGRPLWWYTGAAEMTMVVQIIVGVLMVSRLGIELPELHALYGFSGLIAIGIVYSYRSQMRHRLYLLYGGGGLFLMGLGIRAMVLGPGG